MSAKANCGAILALFLAVAFAFAQSEFTAWQTTSPVTGNHEVENGLGIGEDFRVYQPIAVSQLGVFDGGGNGIQGSATLTVHLYASNPDRARKNDSGVLLETVTFDAANPGQLKGNFRYKPLLHPVTLLPGQYTITAEGFDQNNLVYKIPENQLSNRLRCRLF